MGSRHRGREDVRPDTSLVAVAVGVVLVGVVASVLPACGEEAASPEGNIGLPGRPRDGEDAGVDGATSAAPDAGSAPVYVDFDINHVLITGQSNAVSNSGTPVLSTSQPFTNLMFDTGVMPMKGGFANPADHASARTEGCDGEGCTAYQEPTKLVPLVEGDRFFDYEVETCASGLANEISHLATTRHAMQKHDVLASIHARSGVTYQCVRKGSCNYKPDYLGPFEQGMKEVTSGKALATALGKSYVVRAVAAIHGESDHYSYSSATEEFPLAGTDGTAGAIASYADGLVEWQRYYETGVKAITGQTLPVPLFVSQISGWNDLPSSKVAQFQIDAHVKAPGKVILIGPSYALPLDQSDCLHFTNEGERRLGEYFAKVYAHVVLAGKTWEPVRPKAVTRAGAVITIVFHVPKPPLAIDTTRVAPAANQGFTFDDGTGAGPAITAVEVTGPDTVQVTLDAEPTGTTKRLRYAMNQPTAACIGTPTGARGNLRDSDDTASKHGYDLQNWAVHFDVAVP
jgi:hypothetical protein